MQLLVARTSMDCVSQSEQKKTSAIWSLAAWSCGRRTVKHYLILACSCYKTTVANHGTLSVERLQTISTCQLSFMFNQVCLPFLQKTHRVISYHTKWRELRGEVHISINLQCLQWSQTINSLYLYSADAWCYYCQLVDWWPKILGRARKTPMAMAIIAVNA